MDKEQKKTKNKTKNKKRFEKKKFFKLLDKALFGKTMENVRKHIKLVTTEARSNYLVSEANYDKTFFFIMY